jgi:hypothetical protein
LCGIPGGGQQDDAFWGHDIRAVGSIGATIAGVAIAGVDVNVACKMDEEWFHHW